MTGQIALFDGSLLHLTCRYLMHEVITEFIVLVSNLYVYFLVRKLFDFVDHSFLALARPDAAAVFFKCSLACTACSGLMLKAVCR